MSFNLNPGNALCCYVNAHRHGWNGVICDSPSSWNCGSMAQFREDYCERRNPSCFHINLFNRADPSLVIGDNGAAWILDDHPDAFNDQIMLFGNKNFNEPRGLVDDRISTQYVYGAYRIKSVERVERPWRDDWIVRPYDDGWIRLFTPRIRMPRWQYLGGPYIREIDRSALERTFENALVSMDDPGTEWIAQDDRERFLHFAQNLGEWLDVAAEKTSKTGKRIDPPTTGREVSSVGVQGNFPLKELSALVVDEPRVEVKPKEVEETDHPFLIEPKSRVKIAQNYGDATLKDILVASLTKPLMIIRGDPGVGKSTLALNLIDDPERERTHVVAVSSTWRGREDLLGYTNPVDNCFEPTEFTNFLLNAEKAWDAGDKRTRLVVFEEFNLSQPEYWLSEILVRTQYEDSARADRQIELGGQNIRGWNGREPSAVYLPPNIRFVATVNTDHTTRPLSPRVLDRATVIRLEMGPGRVLERAGLSLEDDQLEAIKDLNFIVRKKNAAFSLRTAISMKSCFEHKGGIGLDGWGVIDVVLTQEILSKVKLFADDPVDIAICEELQKWSEAYSSLPRCVELINSWKELVEQGQDVCQA